ncbi:MAG: HAD-IA family hydrolase [Formivibrio sp.]|nr:HAD-IA family hydrolase [Formivibrio sp.]
MIKVVFFDYDGVLTTDKTGSLTTNRYLSLATGIGVSRINSVFNRYNEDLIQGITTHAKIWQRVCGELGQAISINLLYEAFESTPVNLGVFSLASQLKARYTVGIITDNKKDRIDHLKISQKLDALFNPILVSAEIGANKQSVEIFLHALKCTDTKPEECVFIDNNRENLIKPNALGFKTIFHDDDKNDILALVSALDSLGVTLG